MRILSIETSCDETGAAVVEKKKNEEFARVLSNITTSSASLQAQFGGIIPEQAAREQVKWVIPVIVQALIESQSEGLIHDRGLTPNFSAERFRLANRILKEKINAIAVTHGPGLMGSLLVGVETAKTLAFVFQKPIIPVHHLLAHLYANFIYNPRLDARRYQLDAIRFPFIGLIVSGGHTDLLLFESFSKFKWLGGTRDDAAGEALDKIGRLLGFSYPAGSEIEQRAKKVKKTTVRFKSPMIETEDFDFSFSGLKTEVARFVSEQARGIHPIPPSRWKPIDTSGNELNEGVKNHICLAVQKAVLDVLIKKTIRAAKLYNTHQIVLGGGVSANQALINNLELEIRNLKLDIEVFAPPKTYATDNAAMIGSYTLLNYKPVDWHKIKAEPELYFD